MLITRTSQISGITRTKDIPVTEEQLQIWQNGAHIQNCMSNLSEEDREFIMTGITQEEWDEAFKEEE
jgi:hypothetical protein